tara:strand:+ start:19296 stop:20717 length:1422 start_codon:yes stop_codon:yes gene_type:complete
MRVLLVTHRFPPLHTAGTERYTEALALGLAERGHEVHVLAAEKDVTRRNTSLHTRDHLGLQVHEVVQNMMHKDFDETWIYPRVEAVIAQVLRDVKPDVVHVQHWMYLSSGLLGLARASGAKVLLTLHDFFLECPRMGQLRHADGALCETVDFERCGTCLPTFAWRQRTGARPVARALATVKSLTGIDLSKVTRSIARRLPHVRGGKGSGGAGRFTTPKPVDAAPYAAAVRQRKNDLLQAVRGNVHAVIAPSAFLGQRAVAFGLDPNLVHVVPTGVRDLPDPGPRPTRGPEDPVRVLFLGTYVPEKGAHVLLEAWERVPKAVRAKGALRLFGPGGHAAGYEEDLSARAKRLGATFGESLDAAGVARELVGADLLVVPSTWYENRPLVMLEARALGVPVLVSDAGGMAELVREGIDGWRFPLGDAEALSQRLGELLEDPSALRALRPTADELPTWSATLDTHEAHYRVALEGGRA